jgi:hypothetical protein
MRPCRRPWARTSGASGSHGRASRGSTTTWVAHWPRGSRRWASGRSLAAETAVYSVRLDDQLIDRFLAQCPDPRWWMQTIAVIAVHAPAPGG